jgi:peptide/nickel transport system permease protein
MFKGLVKRLLQSVVGLSIMSVIAFTGINLVGDPVQLLVSPNATPQEVAEARQTLGLDQPLPKQYWRFLSNAVHGDLGNSFVFNQPALGLVFERMPATFELATVALLFSALIGIAVGLAAGMKPNGIFHRLAMGLSIAGITIPKFWLGLLLIFVFSVKLGWLPPGNRGATTLLLGVPVSFTTLDGWRHLLLPAATLAAFYIALVIRLTEAGTREVIHSEYVKFARAKGVSGARLTFRHIAPNVMIPVVTALGLEFGNLLAFSVVTETVFAWPGMGKLIIDSILRLDRPVVVAYLLVTLVIFLVINLVVDMLYSLLDPRLRSEGAKA